MREILFRGKRVDNGEWVEGYYAKSGDKTFILVDNDIAVGYVIMKEVIPETVGQFTGVIDRTGKKIFEGDIVNSWDSVGKLDVECKTVEWNKLFCSWETGKHKILYGENTIKHYEVVGNVYDLPNLLKRGDD